MTLRFLRVIDKRMMYRNFVENMCFIIIEYISSFYKQACMSSGKKKDKEIEI